MYRKFPKITTQQEWYRRRADKLSAAARRLTKVGGGAHKLSAAAHGLYTTNPYAYFQLTFTCVNPAQTIDPSTGQFSFRSVSLSVCLPLSPRVLSFSPKAFSP